MEERANHLYKIVLIGDAGVGKTHLLNRYVRKALPPKIIPTIGVEFATIQVQLKSGESIKAQLWDTAGQERYRAITQAHYKRAVGAILVYDITNKKTFDNLQRWLEEVRENSDEQIVLALLGNKEDLIKTNPQQRRVGTELAKRYSKDENLFFREISAFEDQDVEKFFQDFFEEVYASLNIVQYTETEQSQYEDTQYTQRTRQSERFSQNMHRQSQQQQSQQRNSQNKQHQDQQQKNQSNNIINNNKAAERQTVQRANQSQNSKNQNNQQLQQNSNSSQQKPIKLTNQKIKKQDQKEKEDSGCCN